MKIVTISVFLLLWALIVSGFRIPHVVRVPTHLLSKALGQIDICAKGIELTSVLKEQVEHKIGKATKNSSPDITSIHVKLKGPKISSTETHTHMKMDSMIAEVTVGFKGGGIIHVHDTSDHMHSSVNLVAHKLQKAVNRRHEKLRDTAIRAERRSTKEEYDEMQDYYGEDLGWARKYKSTPDWTDQDVDLRGDEEASAEDQFVEADVDDLLVEREKRFAMAPMSVQEATAALGMIDHPFYVFRNKNTNEVAVVYRRKSGGVGHIAASPRSTANSDV